MKVLYSLLCVLFLGTTLHADERILDFVSRIEVMPDAHLHVTESITVRSEQDAIKRGIVREFPTRYTDRYGNHVVVDFDVLSVMHNGMSTPYRIKDAVNGKRIFIGSKNTYIKEGKHTYTISYRTSRQLGFFGDRDELYWNVTGSGWRFPIDHVRVHVRLPAPIVRENLQAGAYTGPAGAKGADYRARYSAPGEIEFETTKPLARYEGLTVVVNWPAGHIKRPDWKDNFWYFVHDNMGTIWVWLGILILSMLYSFWYIRIRRRKKYGTVIPLFYPPKDMSPGLARYIYKGGAYDNVAFAAEVVDVAVHGFLTIEYTPKTFGGTYTLQRVKDKDEPDNPIQSSLIRNLFWEKEIVHVNQDRKNVPHAYKTIESGTALTAEKYFEDHTEYVVTSTVLSCIFGLPAFFTGTSLAIVGAMILGLLWLIFYYAMRDYSDLGRTVKEEIDGFRMYLATAETERMKIIGTPPIKTPELYEKYLPYAMALGCEGQWTKQFAPIFTALEQRGTPYHPYWMHGYHGRFAPHVFSHALSKDLGYAFSRSIASAQTPSGYKSGGGGRGSSGGGGGGGGGGGW